MTDERDDDGRCRWCGRRFPRRSGPGRPREFCKQSCRQRDYESRQRSAEVGLSDRELIVARHTIDDLRDRLYVLECAIEDVRRDLTGSPTKADYRDAVGWLVESAEPLLSVLGDDSVT